MLSQFDYRTILAGVVAIASGFVAPRAIEKYGNRIKSSESQEGAADNK